jgi:autotransporter-associated beta strand protein
VWPRFPNVPRFRLGRGCAQGGNGGGAGGALTKTGTGTLTLGGNNTFTGLTTVNAGKLVITGSTASPILVNSGGVLAGSGTINGNVENAGVVAPGDPQSLDIVGNYLEDSGATLELAIAGPGDLDHLHVTGDFTIDSGATLKLDFIDGFAPTTGQQFDFISFGGSLDGAFAQVQIDGLEPGFQFQVQPDGSGNFGLTALNNAVSSTPEPASLGVLVLGMSGLLVKRRRQRN